MTAPPAAPRLADFAALAWREWRHHPWRHAAALLAVALGVALAASVHLINASALSEFSAALRATNGEPDLTITDAGGGALPDAAYARLLAAPGVRQASPVIAFETYARLADGTRTPLQVLGVDALTLASLAPDLVPRPAEGEDRLAFIDPSRVFLNAAARSRLAVADGDMLALQSGGRWQTLRVAGWVSAGGGPLAVMDLSAAQDRFGFAGRLTRVDLRLEPGAAPPPLPAVWRAERPDDAAQRVSQLSRAYRVNLTVLALVALFVGGFLVYSVVALSVAQRLPGFALLGVLGLTARERRRVVMLECLGMGMLGSLVGVMAGIALAAAALRWLAGDLGGGYFPGVTPPLRLEPAALALLFVLGTMAALLGGWVPARAAERLQPARALKGLSSLEAPSASPLPAVGLLAIGAALAFAPPIAGLPLAAYASVACLLFGGVAAVPWVVQAVLARWPLPQAALPRLALQRAVFQRHTATAAVAGVVAALALSVALTVMVGSFRAGVTQWLDTLLPADLYARTATRGNAADQAWLPEAFIAEAAALPGVERVQGNRLRLLSLAADRPAVALIAREVGNPAQTLPLVGTPLAAAAGDARPACYVSEAMVSLYGAEPGSTLSLPLEGATLDCVVRGVWRDYARQFGSVVIELADYRRLTGDTRLNDLALWLAPDAAPAAVREALSARMADPSMLEFAEAGEIRAISLRIFDRSFAVTRWLQMVAIAVGLVGVAASLSAQVAARRKEFGLLSHLGLTRRQTVALVAGEAAAWLTAGALIGVALGVAVSAVLVHVVNPQSFHWTMDLVLPWPRLAALALAVLAAGTATAAITARRAAGRAAVMSVKEDW
ncbi:FtsX-like permease family protein [Rubrivivax albus]|uniref:FtsX-like permease family protein n=1 Tax=Rubrivivax albus TaxID=2499835 RepID=UPI001E4A7C62|nr:ABC transporter permease [Rubrivivax albus]